MLVYGGRNDLAYNKAGCVVNRPSVYLDDIMLFEFDTSQWTTVL